MNDVPPHDDARQHARVREAFLSLRDLDGTTRADALARLAREEPEVHEAVRRLLDAPVPADADTLAPVLDRLDAAPDDPDATVAARDGADDGAATDEPLGTRLDPHDPDRIGPYRLVRRLGRGGMGVVYLAVRDDGTFRRRVALKLVQRGLDFDDFLRRFEQERQILAALEHPSIARLLDGGRADDGRPYLVLEYVEGTDLRTWCETQRLDLDARIRIMRQVCAAVDAAQQAGVIHCDLKPGNILVEDGGRPRLLDFGIARLANPEIAGLPVDPTRAHRPMTKAYAAPELRDGRPVTFATDVFALGTMLYELLVGARPADVGDDPEHPVPPSTAVARDLTDTLTAETTTTSTRPSDDPRVLRRRIRGDLDNIVLKAVAHRPQDRYAFARELAEDLDRFLDDRTVHATAPRAGYLARKFWRRHRTGVALTVATAAAVVFLGTSLALGWAGDVKTRENVALRERNDARRELLLDSSLLLLDAQSAIAQAPGRLDLRRRLGDRVVENLDRLEADPDLPLAPADRVALARALVGAALARVHVGTPDDATRRSSLARLDRAVAILDSLRDEAVSDGTVREVRGLARVHAGWLHDKLGDASAADAAWQEALTVARDDGCGDAVVDGLRARVLLRRGERAYRASDDPAEARRLLEQSIVLRRRLDDEPSAAELHRLVRAMNRLAHVLAATPEGAERALALADEQLALLEDAARLVEDRRLLLQRAIAQRQRGAAQLALATNGEAERFAAAADDGLQAAALVDRLLRLDGESIARLELKAACLELVQFARYGQQDFVGAATFRNSVQDVRTLIDLRRDENAPDAD